MACWIATGTSWPRRWLSEPLRRASPRRVRDAAAKLAIRVDTDYPTWLGDEDRRLVTERLVEIIGEAARAMSAEGRARYPEVDWAGLVGLRNILVHAYHRIQPTLL